jgi:biopolymer transport protein ExbD
MSMNIGSPSGSDEPEVMMEINTTPLIDVMLVLLVMLIITIPIQLHAVNMDMPVGTPPTNLVKPEKIQIDIDDKGVVFWQGLPVTPTELEQDMVQVAQLAVQPEVHIRPNKNAQYAIFANVISNARRKGLTKVAVIGSEQFVQ